MSPHQTNQNKTISRQASQPAEPLNQGNLVIGWPADRTPISELVRIVHLHSLAAGLTLISHSNIRTQADFSELLLPLRVTFRWYYLDTVKNVKFKKNTGGKTIIKNSKTNYINFKFYKNILKKKLFFCVFIVLSSHQAQPLQCVSVTSPARAPVHVHARPIALCIRRATGDRERATRARPHHN